MECLCAQVLETWNVTRKDYKEIQLTTEPDHGILGVNGWVVYHFHTKHIYLCRYQGHSFQKYILMNSINVYSHSKL